MNNNTKALRSGVWYTVANILMKGIGFITTPVFTRLLTHEEFGMFSNYTSWLSTLTIFATLNLSASFISARYDHEKDFNSYISSVLVLSSFITVFFGIIINSFSSFFERLTNLDLKYLNIMLVYMFFNSAIDMFQVRERYYFKYRISVAISLFIAITTALFSVALVLYLDNRLLGRIIGYTLPVALLGIIIYIVIIYKGKSIKMYYWLYALPICIPYIPHLLSLSLLNSMDKMMITGICGAENNALYSLAYTCGTVIVLLVASMNTAFAPWLGEKLNNKNYYEIRNVSKYYIVLFFFLACGIMLITPELLLVMGGPTYYDAIYAMPPVTFGCTCQFLYTLYVNVEQFSKKTVGMAFASAFAALSNYVLNLLFIPRYGYIAAAYTTLISYMILLAVHMIIVRKIGLSKVYSNRFVIMMIGIMCIYTAIVTVSYSYSILRFALLLIYAAAAVVIIKKNWNLVQNSIIGKIK